MNPLDSNYPHRRFFGKPDVVSDTSVRNESIALNHSECPKSSICISRSNKVPIPARGDSNYLPRDEKWHESGNYCYRLPDAGLNHDLQNVH